MFVLKVVVSKVSQRCQPAAELEELAKWADNQSTVQTKEAHRLIEPTISQIHTCTIWQIEPQ